MFSPSLKLDVGFASSESVLTRHGFGADRHALDKRNARRVQAALATLTARGASFVSLSALVPLSVS